MTADVTVVGAGLTGLTTAYWLTRKGISVHVIETRGRIGGQIRTNHKNEFIFETGPTTGAVSTPEVAELIDRVYNAVLINGTHKAPSIKVAEAAKVIENSQRDINIAFVNELSKIFTLMGIDTYDVLEAAGTKWNFIKMNPGLVGGHCISVDPYYLAQCAQRLGYNPEIILAGRRMNDGMGAYVADQTIKLMLKKGIQVLGSKIIIMGFTFKENCPDVRNTRVIDIYHALQEYNVRPLPISVTSSVKWNLSFSLSDRSRPIYSPSDL